MSGQFGTVLQEEPGNLEPGGKEGEPITQQGAGGRTGGKMKPSGCLGGCSTGQ